jgi:predicted extracellular nuclease
VRSNGFYVEDPVPDADPATSEGLFVCLLEVAIRRCARAGLADLLVP